MAGETSNKKDVTKRRWKKKVKKLTKEDEIDDSHFFDDSPGNLLGVGASGSNGEGAEFRWSLSVGEGITNSSHLYKARKSNRVSTHNEDELYLSNEFNVVATVNEDDLENENAEDTRHCVNQQKNSNIKTKKIKKKKLKARSNDKPCISRLVSTRRKSDRSSKLTKSLSKMKEASNGNTTKKKKKRKKKAFSTSVDSAFCSNDSKVMGEETGLKRSPEPRVSNMSSKLSRTTSSQKEAADFESVGDTEKTDDTTQVDSAEADDKLESPPAHMVECKVGNPNLWLPRPSNRHSILKDKIRASLASLGEESAVSAFMLEAVSVVRSSEVSNSDRSSNTPIDPAFWEAFHSEYPRSSEVSNSHRSSYIPSDPAFLEAFHSEYRESFKRMSAQNKDMMENLLDELHQYESQLEEERNEISKERCMMQLKQETVEQMLATEMDRISQLESENFDLSQRLEAANKAKGDDALLEKIKMLETEIEVLRKKTERQDQSIASMVLQARREDDTSGCVFIQNLSGKEQGELLRLRYAFEDQAKELASMKEKIRSTDENQQVKELEQALVNAEEQKMYFMNETQRLKKILATKFASKRSERLKSTNRWFGFSDKDDSHAEKCLLDMAETNMVFGSASDTIVGDIRAFPEHEEGPSGWLPDRSSSWLANSSSSWMEA